jgi:hypothetical protein
MIKQVTYLLLLLALVGCASTGSECPEERSTRVRVTTSAGVSTQYCCAKVGPSYIQDCSSPRGQLDFVLFGDSVVEIKK